MNAARHFLIAAIAICAAIGPASAQSPMNSGPSTPSMGGGMSMQNQADRDMMDAMSKMHREMSAAQPTGNADQDFVAMMIPHHQGAIDMAQVELKYGKDPGLRRLAKDIVSAQEKEIKTMRAWQARHRSSP